MANIQKLVPHILKWEGGWANDPHDKGGPTMKGVTLTTYTAYCKKKGKGLPTQLQLKNISQAEWEDILKTMYWDKWNADKIKTQSIANLLVDWVWASGSYGIKFPQRVLGVKDDGIVGDKTLAAINNYPNQKELWTKLWNRRKKHFEDIVAKNPSQGKFLKGWMNRLKDLKWEG